MKLCENVKFHVYTSLEHIQKRRILVFALNENCTKKMFSGFNYLYIIQCYMK